MLIEIITTSMIKLCLNRKGQEYLHTYRTTGHSQQGLNVAHQSEEDTSYTGKRSGVEFPKRESPFIVTEGKPQEGVGGTWEEEAEEACPEPEHHEGFLPRNKS